MRLAPGSLLGERLRKSDCIHDPGRWQGLDVRALNLRSRQLLLLKACRKHNHFRCLLESSLHHSTGSLRCSHIVAFRGASRTFRSRITAPVSGPRQTETSQRLFSAAVFSGHLKLILDQC